jgi:hypothetical protein
MGGNGPRPPKLEVISFAHLTTHHVSKKKALEVQEQMSPYTVKPQVPQ